MTQKIYVILVDNYDEENSGAEILDNKFFDNREFAKAYLRHKIDFIVSDRWTAEQEDNEDYIVDNNIDGSGTFTAEDRMTGQRLEISIQELLP